MEVLKKIVTKKVEDLVPGDKVDMESCPYLFDQPSAKYQLAEVLAVERETPDCVVVSYEIDDVGYPPGTMLRIEVGA